MRGYIKIHGPWPHGALYSFIWNKYKKQTFITKVENLKSDIANITRLYVKLLTIFAKPPVLDV